MERLALAALGALYIAQGIPLYYFTVGIASILRKEGVGLEWLGLLTSGIAMPWTFKFLWAPLIDRWGHRRVWISTLHLATGIMLFALTWMDLHGDLLWFLVWGLLISFVACTQDIAVDAYAIERFPIEKRGIVNALQASGAAIGSLLGGTLLLLLYERFGWIAATRALSILVILTWLPFLAVIKSEPHQAPAKSATANTKRPSLIRALWRPEIRVLLMLAAAIRFCEGFAMIAQQPVLIDAGVSLDTVGIVIGVGGIVVGLSAAWLAGMIQRPWGNMKTLMTSLSWRTFVYILFTIAMAFGVKDHTYLITLVVLNIAARYLIYVPLYSIYMRGTSLTQSGTDFALLIGGDYLFYFACTALGGVVAEHFGYTVVFSIAACGSIVSLILTPKILKKLAAVVANQDIAKEEELQYQSVPG